MGYSGAMGGVMVAVIPVRMLGTVPYGGTVGGNVGKLGLVSVCCMALDSLWACFSFCLCCALVRTILLIELTEGTLILSQIPSCNNRSRISHANMLGLSCL